MINALGIVQVRPEATASDWRVTRSLSGKSLLEHLVRRMTDCLRLDRVVVVLSGHEADQQICRLMPPDVAVVAPAGRDPLATFAAVADEFQARSVVRVFADNPFVDPVLIDRLVSTADAHPACDYISYCHSDGRPTIGTSLALFAEWCSAAALAQAQRAARRASDRDHVTEYLYSHPETFNVRLIPLPAGLERGDLRFQIDGEEDWEHVQALYEALGPDEWDWQRIAELMRKQSVACPERADRALTSAVV